MTTLVTTSRLSTKLIFGFALLFATSSQLTAGTILSISRGISTSVEIRLANDQAVSGMQFVVRSSSDIILQEIRRADRTSSSNWMVANHRVDDSTIKVVIISADMSSFAVGAGTIITLSYVRNNESASTSRVSLANVLVADPQARAVAVEVGDLMLSWNSASSKSEAPQFVFGQNYPNPFNPSTSIGYRLMVGANVHLSIYDVTGREIRTLVDQYMPPGSYQVSWNSTDEHGFSLPSGTYFARIQVGANVATRKMLLTK
jgi:hypothetical protein